MKLFKKLALIKANLLLLGGFFMPMNYLKWLFALNFFLINSIFAQHYSFNTLTIEDGLAQSQITKIIQDKQGFLWIGTLGGISKFDGINFQNYSTKNGLFDNQIHAIYEDNNSKIWVGTQEGIHELVNDSFHFYPLKSIESTAINAISIEQLNDSTLLVGTANDVLLFFNTKSKKYQVKSYKQLYVRAITQFNNSIYLGTRNGIYEFNSKDSSLTIFGDSSYNVSGFSSYKNTLFISTYGNGVIRYQNNNFREYSGNSLVNFPSNFIRSVAAVNENEVWCASSKGAFKVAYGSTQILLNESNGLNRNNIRYIFRDQQDNTWIGTDGGGISKFSGETFVNFSEADGMSSEIVMSFCQTSDSMLFMGTYTNGIEVYNGSQFTNINYKQNLSNNIVWSLSTTKGDTVYAATSEGVSFIYKDKVQQLLPNVVSGRISNVTWINNQLYIGGRDAIYLVNKNHELIQKIESIQNTDVKLTRSFIQFDSLKILSGCRDGLLMLTPDSNYFISKEISSIINIQKDLNHNFWVGTKDGLYALSPKLELKRIPLSSNLSNEYINFSIIDNENTIWVGTDQGIYSLQIDSFTVSGKAQFQFYNKNDGIISLETNQNATFKDLQGNLWFGTNEGVIKYNPRVNANKPKYSPPIHLTNLLLTFEEFDWQNKFKTVNQQEVLHLKYNENHLTFNYTAIDLSAPKNVTYTFKLNDFDKNWSPLSTTNFATYSNIPPGEYVFEVKALSKENVWSETLKIPLIIAPPFWNTWWFYILIALSSSGILYMVYYWRLNEIKRQQETENLKDKAKMLALEQQALNASMNRHFIFNALNSIQYYINTQDKFSANVYLSDFARLVRKNLDSSQSTLVYLNDELERLELYLSLEQMRFPEKFNYKIWVDPEVDTYSTKIPSMLLQPFVENSIWHGILPSDKNGSINIKIELTDSDQLIFTIEDDGIGITESLNRKKNEPKKHISKGMEITKNRLELLKKFKATLVFIDGPKQINNEQGKAIGTIVKIGIPVDENYLL